MFTKKIPLFVLCSLIYVFCSVFSLYFVSLEREFYFWDYSGYFNAWKNCFTLFQSDFPGSIQSLLSTIRSSDYNWAPVYFLAPFHYLGEFLPFSTRQIYIASICIVYVGSFICLFTFLVNSSFGSTQKIYIRVVPCLIALFLTPVWSASLRGFPDVVGEIFVLIVIFLPLKVDLTNTKNWPYGLLLGGLLWCPFLFRRWYAYTCLTLYILLPIFSLLIHEQFCQGKFHSLIKRFQGIICIFGLAALVNGVLLYAFQDELVFRVLHTNYSELYAGYQLGFDQSVNYFFAVVGKGFLLIAILMTIITLFLGGKVSKVFNLLCWFALVMSFLMMTSTQTPSPHHFIPFSVWIALIIASGFLEFCKYLSGSQAFLASFITVVFCFWGFQQPFFVKQQDRTTLSTFLYPFSSTPLIREKYNNYIDLFSFIESLPATASVSVFVSSSILNDDMVLNYLKKEDKKKLLLVSQVDSRDKIYPLMFASSFALVSTPTQIHLPNGQYVIEIPNSLLRKQVGPGVRYEKLERTFLLDGGVKVEIYKKKQPIQLQDIEYFLNEMFQVYPSWAESMDNAVNKTLLTTSLIQQGDIWGGLSVSNSSIFTHPGETLPTIFSMDLSAVSTFRISSTDTKCNVDDTIILEINNEKHTRDIHLQHGATEDIDVSDFGVSTITIRKNKSSGCDTVKIEVIP